MSEWQPIETDPSCKKYGEAREKFKKALSGFLNSHNMENFSDTPDYILAQYLSDCLNAFDSAVLLRRNWHSKEDTENWWEDK